MIFHKQTRDGDYITIMNDELPEVSAQMSAEGTEYFVAGSGPEECRGRASENPDWLRSHALSALAVADRIEREQKAAVERAAEAEAALAALRDGVALEIYATKDSSVRYDNATAAMKRAIDLIIEAREANK